MVHSGIDSKASYLRDCDFVMVPLEGAEPLAGGAAQRNHRIAATTTCALKGREKRAFTARAPSGALAVGIAYRWLCSLRLAPPPANGSRASGSNQTSRARVSCLKDTLSDPASSPKSTISPRDANSKDNFSDPASSPKLTLGSRDSNSEEANTFRPSRSEHTCMWIDSPQALDLSHLTGSLS